MKTDLISDLIDLFQVVAVGVDHNGVSISVDDIKIHLERERDDALEIIHINLQYFCYRKSKWMCYYGNKLPPKKKEKKDKVEIDCIKATEYLCF